MADLDLTVKWNIVLTKAGCERKVAGLFAKKQIEHYWPMNTLRSYNNGVTKTQLEPLFKSYVFVRINENQVQKVLKVQHVVNFVYWLNKPAVIKDEEIETIQFFLRQYQTLQIEKTEVDINEGVKNLRGSSITKAGNVTEMLNNSTKAILPSLGFILISQIPENTDTVIFNNMIYKPADKLIVKEEF